jgi:formate hydrogenlyase subunit 3/multisubunit Na+/H+ antiporter MnhD subunit
MGGAASTIYLVGRVRRRSRTKATLLMIGLDSAYGIFVAKNYHR